MKYNLANSLLSKNRSKRVPVFGGVLLAASLAIPGLGAIESTASAAGDPVGALDVVALAPGPTYAELRIRGWAKDPDSSEAINVHAYVDGVYQYNKTQASDPRPDVGGNHGYTISVAVLPGPHTFCTYAINVGAGNNVLLGCKDFVSNERYPIGSLDMVSMHPDDELGENVGITVTGWAIDPVSNESTNVHFYLDGALKAVATADIPREDVNVVFSEFTGDYGFETFVPASPGSHEICAYGISVKTRKNSLTGCRTIVLSSNPIGSLDIVKRIPGGINAAGWTLDPDTWDAVMIHVYVDGVFLGDTWAEDERLDVEKIFPNYGPYHGFDVSFDATAAPHKVCIYALTEGAGQNVLVGCQMA